MQLVNQTVARALAKFLNWRVAEDIPPEARRCVLVAGPHTSNWDFLYCVLSFRVLNLPARFTIKDDWMKFPYGPFIRSVGGIGIQRQPAAIPAQPPPPGVAAAAGRGQVEAMAKLFSQHDELALAVTAEGTRKRTTRWKTGFYYVALQAKVPICCGYLDYAKRESGISQPFWPTGNIDEDMRRVMGFFAEKGPKYPEKFALDERYILPSNL